MFVGGVAEVTPLLLVNETVYVPVVVPAVVEELLPLAQPEMVLNKNVSAAAIANWLQRMRRRPGRRPKNIAARNIPENALRAIELRAGAGLRSKPG